MGLTLVPEQSGGQPFPVSTGPVLHDGEQVLQEPLRLVDAGRVQREAQGETGPPTPRGGPDGSVVLDHAERWIGLGAIWMNYREAEAVTVSCFAERMENTCRLSTYDSDALSTGLYSPRSKGILSEYSDCPSQTMARAALTSLGAV